MYQNQHADEGGSMKARVIPILFITLCLLIALASFSKAQIQGTNLTYDGTDAQQNTYTTATISPRPNTLVLLQFNERCLQRNLSWYNDLTGSSNSSASTYTTAYLWHPDGMFGFFLVCQYGATSKIPTVKYGTHAGTPVSTFVGNGYRLTLFRIVPVGQGAWQPYVISYNGSGPDRVSWNAQVLSEVDVTGTNGQNAVVQVSTATTTNGSSLTMNLPNAFSAGNNGSFWAVGSSLPYNTDSGWATSDGSLVNGSGTGQIAAGFGYRPDPDVSSTVYWKNNATGPGLGIIAEVKAARVIPWPVISVTGCGLTWVPVDSVHGAWGKPTTRLYRAMGTSPNSGPITISYSPASTDPNWLPLRVSWSVSEFEGVNTSGTNGSGAIVQKGTASTGSGSSGGSSLTVNLAPFQNPANAVYGGFNKLGDYTSTWNRESGYTQLTQGNLYNNWDGLNSMTCWKPSPDQTVFATCPWGHSEAIAVEIRASTVPVPVQLVSFSGRALPSNRIQLAWRTATEINNYGFAIERSTEPGTWSEIGFVEGNGTSNISHSYGFIDNMEGVVLYDNSIRYRLRQIDRDGSTAYSQIVEVLDSQSASPLTLTVSPSPAHTATAIHLRLSEPSTVSVKIYNAIGMLIQTVVESSPMQSGSHSLPVDVQRLKNGMYFAIANTGNGALVKPFIVQ